MQLKSGIIVTSCTLLAAAGILLMPGGKLSTNRPTGQPQLVAINPLPQPEGEMCEWEPASYAAGALPSASMFAAAAADEAKSEIEQRKPVRTIRDPYSAYSSVAVDPIHNEVVLTDENLFNILVYDRTANTPPTAKMTEPK